MGLMTYSRRLGRRHLERSLAIWKSVSPPLAEPVANYEVIAPDPAKVSKRIPRLPDPHLIPDYSGLPSRTQSHVGDPFQEPVIWTGEQIEGIRKACQLARTFLSRAAELVEPGTPTEAIDAQVHELIVASDSYPSPLNFEGFPRSISTSVNNVACHGVPDGRPLKDGDLITIDVTVFHKGYHGDTSKTWIVGEKRSEQGRRLVNGAQECLFQGKRISSPLSV